MPGLMRSKGCLFPKDIWKPASNACENRFCQMFVVTQRLALSSHCFSGGSGLMSPSFAGTTLVDNTVSSKQCSFVLWYRLL